MSVENLRRAALYLLELAAEFEFIKGGARSSTDTKAWKEVWATLDTRGRLSAVIRELLNDRLARDQLRFQARLAARIGPEDPRSHLDRVVELLESCDDKDTRRSEAIRALSDAVQPSLIDRDVEGQLEEVVDHVLRDRTGSVRSRLYRALAPVLGVAPRTIQTRVQAQRPGVAPLKRGHLRGADDSALTLLADYLAAEELLVHLQRILRELGAMPK